MNKSFVMLGAVVGSTIGGYAPVVFGLSTFSFTALITSFIGGLIGVWLTIKFVS